MNFDFKNMETYQYFIVGGAGVAVLAILAYFVAGGKLKLPAIVAASLGSLVLGVGAGVMLLGALGYNWNEKPKEEAPPGDQAGQGPVVPKGPGGMMPKKDSTGKKDAPVSKTQLALLVNKLNQLTDKPLTVPLDADKKKKIAEQIKDLGGMENLSDDEAKKRVEALHDVVKDDRAALEAVGYRWSMEGGKGGGGFGKPKEQPANPFKEGAGKENLEALLKRVEK